MIQSFTPQLTVRLSLIAVLALGPTFVLHAESEAKKSIAATTNEASASSATNTAPAASAPASHSVTVTIDSKPHSDDGEADDPNDTKNELMLGLTALLIPIAGIVACFGTPVLIVLLYFVFRNKRRRENLALAREFLNKGIPVPPQLLDESLKYAQVASAVASVRPQQRSDLRKGIKLVSIGLAVGVVFYVFWPHSTTWAWAFFL